VSNKLTEDLDRLSRLATELMDGLNKIKTVAYIVYGEPTEERSREIRKAEEVSFRRGYFEGYEEGLSDADDYDDNQLMIQLGRLAVWKDLDPSSMIQPPPIAKTLQDEIQNSAAVKAVDRVISLLKHD